jgi:hypothetical protein
MKLAKPKRLVPDKLTSILPRQPAYGMFGEWDTRDCKGSFSHLDEQQTEEKIEAEDGSKQEKKISPFPKGFATKHRFRYFGNAHLPGRGD